MKERLKAMLEGPREKLAPIFEKTAKSFPFFKRLGRWALYSLILPIFLVAVAIMAFFFVYPAHELKPWVAHNIQQKLRAEQVSIADIRWDHSVVKLSLGFKINQISIENASWMKNIHADTVRVSFGLLNFITQGLPFEIELDGLVAESSLKSTSPQKAYAVSQNFKSKIISWTQSLFSLMHGYHLELKNSEIRFISEERPSNNDENQFNFFLKNISLKASINATFDQKISLTAEIQTGRPSQWALAGPLKIDSKSRISLDGEDRLESLVFDKLDIDLKNTSWTAHNFIERVGGEQLLIKTQPHILFQNTSNETKIESIQIDKSQLYIDDLIVDFNAARTPKNDTLLEWSLARSEVSKLHLPIKGLRRGPGKGIVSSSGKFLLRDSLKNSEASWRFMLNNYRIESSYMAPAWGDRNILSGDLKISFVNEGTLQHGNLNIPHSEIQIDATDVAWIPAHSAFIKPAGNKALFLSKFNHKDQVLEVSQLDLDFHTLQFSSNGRAKDIFNGLVNKQRFNFEYNFNSNNINLSDWSSMLPSFKQAPLQGYFQSKGNLSSDVIYANGKPSFDKFAWNFDRFQLSQLRGGVGSSQQNSIEGLEKFIEGPFEANLFFTGRGLGSRVDQAKLISKIDLSEAEVKIGNQLRKPKTYPLVLEISADQNRNRLNIDRGNLIFADLDLGFSGSLIQGMGRSKLDLKMKTPIQLSSWKPMILDPKLREVAQGQWFVNGAFAFPASKQIEQAIDWSLLSFEGNLQIDNFAWHSKVFGNFEKLSGRLRFLNDQVQFNSFSMLVSNNRFTLDGQIRPLRPSKTIYVRDFVNKSAWTSQLNIDVPQIELTRMLQKMESIDKYSLPEFLRRNTHHHQSRHSLNLNLKNVLWENKPLFKDFLGKMEYQDGRWVLRPFNLVHGSSKFQGSATLDLNPLWMAQKSPQWAASLKSTNTLSNDLPFDLGFEEALINTDLTLTTQGQYFSEWEQNFRVRGLVHINQAKNSLWISSLENHINHFFKNSEARDYLLSDAIVELCTPSFQKGISEVHWNNNKLTIERMRQDLKDKGRFDLEGSVETKQNKTLVQGKAAFKFSSSCFTPKGHSCFDEVSNNRGWILDFSQSPRDIKNLNYSFDVDNFGESFRACMARKTSEEIQQKISNEI